MRTLLLVGCFVLFAALVLYAVYGMLAASGVEYPPIGLNVIRVMENKLAKVSERKVGRRVQHVVFLGDSTVISYPLNRTVPVELQKATNRITRKKPYVRVHSLAIKGMGPFDHYFLADEVVDAKPDQIVLVFNLASVSDRARLGLARPELSGWVRPRRIPQAFGLPMHWIGLTADRLVFYAGIVQAGGYAPWRFLAHEQARLGRAREDLEVWVGETVARSETGRAPEIDFRATASLNYRVQIHVAGRDRYNAEGEHLHFGRALAGIEVDQPALQILGATLQVFQRANIYTLVYLNPTNVDNLRAVGVLDPEGLAKTIASVETVAHDRGAEFVDLHALLPDAGFRDAAGHFAFEDVVDGPKLLGEALAPILAREARHAAGSPD